MRYLLMLFLAIGLNLQANEYQTDKCGQRWVKTTKWFYNQKALKKFLVKLKKQESVCGEWRSYEDIWIDEDSKTYSEYITYWIKAEREK